MKKLIVMAVISLCALNYAYAQGGPGAREQGQRREAGKSGGDKGNGKNKPEPKSSPEPGPKQHNDPRGPASKTEKKIKN